MADVSGRGRDRGQLFVVGALIIATLLVVLALFLNSGIYAQNLAARNADPGVSGAVEYRGAVADTTAGTMTRLNREDPANATHGGLEDDLTDGMTEWSNGTAVHGSYRSEGREATVTGTVDGTLVRQNATRAFTNRTGNTSDWTVVDDADRVRGFRMNVTDDELIDVIGDPLSDAFRVSITDDVGDTYNVSVGKTGAGEVNVTVDHPTGSASCEESFDANDRALVDVTNASVQGNHCDALTELADADSPYTIEYGNPDEANGTYELVVRGGTVDGSEFHDPGEGSPWTADAVYSADVKVFFRAREVAYETAFEVVPEEELS